MLVPNYVVKPKLEPNLTATARLDPNCNSNSKTSTKLCCKTKVRFKPKLNGYYKVSKGAKIRNRYNQVPHLTQDTNGKVTNSQLDNTNENQEVSPFPAGDHKAHINRCAQRHSRNKAEKTIKDPQKKFRLGKSVKYFTGGLKPV